MRLRHRHVAIAVNFLTMSQCVDNYQLNDLYKIMSTEMPDHILAYYHQLHPTALQE